MYAVIVTGGKQYRVSEGDTVYVEKLEAAVDSTVTLDHVLLVDTGNSVKLGTPTVKGASVEAKVVKHGKQKKVTVFTYRPKKDSKRKLGHRQQYTKLEITSIKA
jgi:large subunit ribosomal protein L21